MTAIVASQLIARTPSPMPITTSVLQIETTSGAIALENPKSRRLYSTINIVAQHFGAAAANMSAPSVVRRAVVGDG